MGFSISWLAFKDKSKLDVLSLMSLADTGEPDDANESPFSGAELPTGWYIVFRNALSSPRMKMLKSLSRDCSVLRCQVEEHIMFSGASLHTNGKLMWTVCHQSSKGAYHLSAEGDLPETFGPIRDRLFKEQEENGGANSDVDYIFDIPVQLACELCGYRHDQWRFDWGQPTFARLRPTRNGISSIIKIVRG
jgi:hypothetical protein